MGLIINGTKMGKPYINGVKHNAYINGNKIWNDFIGPNSFIFTVQDEGSFNIPVSGVNGGVSAYQTYSWKVDWGDGQKQSVSGTGSSTATIEHTYTDGVGTHTIKIGPQEENEQGWFNAFGSSGSQNASNLEKIKSIQSPTITPSMRTMGSYSHYRMFYNCNGLTAIPSGLLPATTLASYCYGYMFYNCTGLTAIPPGLLPATSLASYCYGYMFYGCTGLTDLPSDLLPATSLASYCYYCMFYNCKGLTAIPLGLLPATTLVNYCYAIMFRYCTSLTEIPTNFLPATTSLATACYNLMFANCTSVLSKSI
jgi:hypothetical protein